MFVTLSAPLHQVSVWESCGHKKLNILTSGQSLMKVKKLGGWEEGGGAAAGEIRDPEEDSSDQNLASNQSWRYPRMRERMLTIFVYYMSSVASAGLSWTKIAALPSSPIMLVYIAIALITRGFIASWSSFPRIISRYQLFLSRWPTCNCCTAIIEVGQPKLANSISFIAHDFENQFGNTRARYSTQIMKL